MTDKKYPFVCPACAGRLNTPGCQGEPIATGGNTGVSQALFNFTCSCGCTGMLTAMWWVTPAKEAANEVLPSVS